MIAMMIGFRDFDLDKGITAYQILVKNTKVRRYVFHSDERQVKVKQTKQLESDTDDKKKDVERTIVSQLQHLCHINNNLVLLFKKAIELMPTDTQLSTKWQSLWSVICI